MWNRSRVPMQPKQTIFSNAAPTFCARFGRGGISQRRRSSFIVRNNIGDDLLDYMQAGPKLRRWYGETEKLVLPKDERQDSSEDEDDGPRDTILVTDADTPMGELIVLQLVLSRACIKVMVRDVVKSKTEFGPYVKAIAGDVDNQAALEAAMRSVKSVIIAGRVGSTVAAAKRLGISHIVLLSSAEQGGGLWGGLFKGPDAALMDPAREAELRASGLAHTILRFGKIQDKFGGDTYIEMQLPGQLPPGPIAREDAALVAVRALNFPPQAGQGLVCQVGGAGPGMPATGDEWSQMFQRLLSATADAS